MKKNVMIIFTILFILMLGALQAQEPVKETHLQRITEKSCMGVSDLTEDQYKNIRTMQTEMQKAMLPLRSELNVVTAEIQKLMIAENPDKSAIMKKVEAAGELRMKIQKLHIENQLKIRGILNAEQRVRFDQKILERSGIPEWEEDGSSGAGPRIRQMKRLFKTQPEAWEDMELEIEVEGE
jgi:Spy/CpxP family protein refolding chaperone